MNSTHLTLEASPNYNLVHGLLNNIATLRTQVDLIRRRSARGMYSDATLEAALVQVRTTIDDLTTSVRQIDQSDDSLS